eukprot:TRINITY_DN14409_c0_g1_i5.p3 TRINITY_DN14409_c0_g1~~TRINITY_DN14409_c0_g1_i5.p3  ORF type:complete len:147 (+),score=22.26 TRINITY_DN14409_c0_g1_i5:920-1360(+)
MHVSFEGAQINNVIGLDDGVGIEYSFKFQKNHGIIFYVENIRGGELEGLGGVDEVEGPTAHLTDEHLAGDKHSRMIMQRDLSNIAKNYKICRSWSGNSRTGDLRACGDAEPVSYTHLRAHETRHDLVCRLLLEKKNRRFQIGSGHL